MNFIANMVIIEMMNKKNRRRKNIWTYYKAYYHGSLYL